MEEIKIPSNSLWQYLEKEHLDTDNKLTQEEWEEFVNMFQGTYADICSGEGQVMFRYYCDEKLRYYCNYYCNEKQVYDCHVDDIFAFRNICLQRREVNAN